jgi:hypothetical protein
VIPTRELKSGCQGEIWGGLSLAFLLLGWNWEPGVVSALALLPEVIHGLKEEPGILSRFSFNLISRPICEVKV